MFRSREASLRDQIEDAIEEAEEDGDTPAHGDLSAIEREMLKNVLGLRAKRPASPTQN